ncbi:IS982 family transposase [Thermococcus sp. M39]|uniref:IS982 family transposase n=1 Tax=unclassified Thermococcus TaxID=2627626 RepID=UPI0014391558|nr:IS982 family transposase [Thermococcus sp. M39]NJE13059.1 IS982 family transposase [Thermococcus sp. LS2]
MVVLSFHREILIIKSEIYPIVSKHYPKNTRREVISLYDLITFAILTHLHFNGVYKHAFRVLIEEMKLFPKIRYNKLTERLNRHEKLLLLAQEELFKKHAREYVRILDSKPIQTKELARKNRKEKKGSSEIITGKPAVGFVPSKKSNYYGYKLTCYSDGNLLALLSIDPANKHDVSVVREKFWGIVEKFTGCFLFLDKGYVSRELEEEFLRFGVVYVPVKRENQISSLGEKKFYRFLSDFRRRIETLFSKLDAFLLRPSWTVSLKGLAVRILGAILAVNLDRLYNFTGGGN